MYDAAYDGRVFVGREAPPPKGYDAPGQRSWFHGDVTAPRRGETAAISWENIPSVPGQRSWFPSSTADQHRPETMVVPREREGSPHEGPAAPG